MNTCNACHAKYNFELYYYNPPDYNNIAMKSMGRPSELIAGTRYLHVPAVHSWGQGWLVLAGTFHAVSHHMSVLCLPA